MRRRNRSRDAISFDKIHISFESIVLSDGSTLVPVHSEGGIGLKSTIDSIDNGADFKIYMQNYAYARGGAAPRGPRREGPAEEGFLPPLPTLGVGAYPAVHANTSIGNGQISQTPDRTHPIFGSDLVERMARDSVELPVILEKCCVAIEKHDLRSQDKSSLLDSETLPSLSSDVIPADMDSVNLDSEEWISLINNVTNVLKMWFRELLDPLLVSGLHRGLMDAASKHFMLPKVDDLSQAAEIENDRLRHVRLRERDNSCPDANYATLKNMDWGVRSR